MLPDWVSKYIGIPYIPKGRTASGLDCYGLAIHVLKFEGNIILKDELKYPATADFSKEAEIAIKSHLESYWNEVESPELFDIAIFKIHGIKSHIGIMIDHLHFLHTYQGADSNLGRIDDKNWAKRLHGYFRINR